MARLAAVVLLVLGLLPIANWIPGGHAAPWYGGLARDWLTGASMLTLVGAGAWVLTRRVPTGSSGATPRWRAGLERIAGTGWRGDLLIGACACVIAAATAWFVYSGKPLLIDEIIQVFQARTFASGRLWLPSPTYPEFTASTHLLDLDGRRFAQFPPGWSLMMAPFSLFRAEWLAGPVAFGLAVLVFARLLRRIESDVSTRMLALLLFAASPFAVFLGASHMNHMPTTLWLLLAGLGLAHNVDDAGSGGLWWPLITGLALGAAATIRPTDAAAFALPTAIWLGWRAMRSRQCIAPFLVSGVGVVVPVALLLAYNAATTGDPLLFGYTAHWGASHGLGFHEAPWGDPHTPLRGLELINLYFLRLQFHLFELPVPGLLLVAAGLLLVRRASLYDRWTLAASAGLLIVYFAYWHDGYFLGPRFVLPLAPWLVLWVARIPAALREREVSLRLRRTLGVVALAAVTWAAVADIPLRATLYANGLQTMRWVPETSIRAAGVTGTVLVRESWGAQTVARLRALGVPGEEIEWLYRGQDSCDLEDLVTTAESQDGAERDSALAVLSARARHRNPTLVSLPEAADTSLRWLPGREPSSACRARFLEMQDGFTLYPPLLLARTDVHFIRDLHARDTLLFKPGQEPRWLLTGDPFGALGPRFERLNIDSLKTAWGRGGDQ